MTGIARAVAALLLVAVAVGMANAGPRDDLPAQAQLTLSMLDADPPAAEVLAGTHDQAFVVQGGSAMHRDSRNALWWRIVADRELSAESEPVLLIGGVIFSPVQVALPGESLREHGIYGPGRDLAQATSHLAVPLAGGLRSGQAILVRLESGQSLGMHVSVQSREQVARDGLVYARWRGIALTLIGMTGLLAMLFALSLNHRSFGWLGLMLVSNLVYAITTGGEAREVPGLGDDPTIATRVSWVAAVLAVTAGCQFLREYLELRTALRWADIVLKAVIVLLLVLLPMQLLLPDNVLRMTVLRAANSIMAIGAVTGFTATMTMAWRRQPGSGFAMLAMFPVIIATGLLALALNGVLKVGGWSLFFTTISVALAGLVLLAGMSLRLLHLRRERDHATHDASHDELTGGWNRRGIEQHLEALVMPAVGKPTQPLSIAFVDIDHFKQINDRHGHAAGDICLRNVADLLRGHLGARGLLGRWGGDELLVLLPGQALPQARLSAERMCQAVREHRSDAGEAVPGCTLSIGVAQWQADDSVRQLLARADAALLQAKREGRDRAVAG